MSIFNIWDQARNTAAIQQSTVGILSDLPRPVPQLSTLRTIQDDKIRRQGMEIRAFGKARFKAFGATPPIFVPKVRYTETEIELVQVHEMSPIDERLLRKLESNDDEIKQRAGADILLRGRALQLRNENQSDWMVMTAILTGQLPIAFEDEGEQGFIIDYGYDPTHLTTVTVPWSTLATATSIDDMRATQVKLADDAGEYGIHFWMNSKTWDHVIYGAQAREILTGTDRGQLIATVEDIKARMYEPERVQFHITDAGWLDEGAAYNRGRQFHTKWFPDDTVLATTSDPFSGEPLVEHFDGLVAVPTSEFAPPQLRQGAQSWTKLDTDALTTYWHQACTRMPRVNRPECIVVMDVS